MRNRRAVGHTWLTCGLAIGGCDRGVNPIARDTANPADPSQSVAAKQLPADTIAHQWRIIPGSSGPFTAQSSEAGLSRRYGAAAVVPERIQLGEGETSPGTVLYPDDSLRRAEIIWQDTVNRRQPARIVLRGNRSQWQVDRGISLGTSLQDLERLNGGPFTLAGFGWDYAGVITDWNGGTLDTLLTGVKLYLDPGPAQYESAPYSQVLGDRDYSSSLPAMQQLSPRVTQIFIDFE